MSINILDALREELPDIFQDTTLPPRSEGEWVVIPIESPESMTPAALEAELDEVDPDGANRLQGALADVWPGTSSGPKISGGFQWQPVKARSERTSATTAGDPGGAAGLSCSTGMVI